MTYSPRLCALLFAAAICSLAVSATPALGQTGADWELIRADGPPQKSWAKQKGHERRRGQATLDMGPLESGSVQEGDRVQLSLFQDQYTGTVTDVTEDVPGVTQVRGDLGSEKWGYFVLSYREGRTRLLARPIGQHRGAFEVRYDPAQEAHMLVEHGPGVYDRRQRDDAISPPEPDSGALGKETGGAGSLKSYNSSSANSPSVDSPPARALEDSSELDVMIVYTPAAAAAVEERGTDIDFAISQAVGNARQTIENTDVELKLNLVHRQEVQYEESGDKRTDLRRLTDSYTVDFVDGEYMNEVHRWRHEYQADLVALFTEYGGGIAWVPREWDQSSNAGFGFSVTGARSPLFSTYTFIHELGHNTGMDHSRVQDTNAAGGDGGRTEYATGWRWIYEGDPHVSVMSYRTFEDVSADRVPTFSSPDLLYEGEVPVGSDGKTGGASWDASFHEEYGPADNRASLRDVRAPLTSQGTSPYVTPNVALPSAVEGNPPADTLTVPIRSTGNATLSAQVDIKGPDAEHFEVLSSGQIEVPPGEKDFARVRYDPETPARHEATLEVSHNASNEESPFEVNLEVTDLDAFITTWETTSPDSSVTIPTAESTSDYDFQVDWGDGTTETYSGPDPDPSHSYEKAGIHTIKISGTFPRIYFNATSRLSDQVNARRLQSIEHWGDVQWESMVRAFAGAENMTHNAADTPDLSDVTDMTSMFGGATSFNGAIGDWDVSNVTDMGAMFEGATSFNQNIGEWDVSSASNSGSFEAFLTGTALSPANYDSLLIGWSQQELTDGLYLGAGQRQYTEAAIDARQSIIEEENWTISDGGLVNQSPTASADSAQTVKGEPVTIDVLANDGDPSGSLDPSTVQVESEPSDGSASASDNGMVTYAPNDGFVGTDSYTYTVADSTGARSNEATVTVEVKGLGVPSNLAATAGAGKVRLSWTGPVGQNPIRYRIYRSTAPIDSAAGPSELPALDSTAAGDTTYADTTYTDTSATPGTEYYYRVTAVDSSANESAFSDEASATSQGETLASIQSQTALSGAAVDVPITGRKLSQVGSVSLVVSYDPSALSFSGGDLQTEDLISSPIREGFSASRPEPGRLRVSWFDPTGTNPIDLEEGTLLEIAFDEFTGDSTEVAFQAESELGSADGSSVGAAFEGGTVASAPEATISGTVSYPRERDSTLTDGRPLEGVPVEVAAASSGETAARDTTGEDGTFGVTVPSGPPGEYVVQARPEETLDVPSEVNATDAIRTVQAFLERSPFAGDFQREVADVNESGSINATDALRMALFFGNPNRATFEAGTWATAPDTVGTADGTDASASVLAAAYGDANLSGGEGSTGGTVAARSAAGEATSQGSARASGAASTAEASGEGDLRSVETGTTFKVPVRLSDGAPLGSGAAVSAYSLEVRFPAETAPFEGIAGTERDVIASAEDGTVRLSWFDRSGEAPMTLGAGSPVVTLRFRADAGVDAGAGAGTETGTVFSPEIATGELAGPGAEPIAGAGLVAESVKIGAAVPEEFALKGSYPNPASGGQATIEMDLPSRASVTVEVYNVLGQKVQTTKRQMSAGTGQTIQLDGSGLASGQYFYQVEAGLGDDASKKTARASGRLTVVR